jgi:hypothetical protein
VVYHKYSDEEKNFIVENVKGRTVAELTELFNRRFGLSLTKEQIVGFMKYYKLRNGILHRYSDEEKNFIVENVKGRTVAELTELFNRRFGLSMEAKTMKSLLSSKGLTTERDTRYTKGDRRSYKRSTIYPVGAERINGSGIKEIKVAQPRKWVKKHRIIWEQANGKIPKNSTLIFADGNTLNTCLENLILVTKRELAVMNKNRLIYDNGDMTRVGKSLAQIKLLIYDRGYGVTKKKNREE